MITYLSGNLFESPATALVNTVNTVGAMGKGIAKNFRDIYPEMFAEYQRLCELGRFGIGDLHVYRTPNKVIINFPTKKNWRNPSRLEYIEAGLATFRTTYEPAGISSVAFLPLGCGNGELDFQAAVRPLMEKYLSDLPIPIYIYAPHEMGAPAEHRTPAQIRDSLRSKPRALPFSEVWEDLRILLATRTSFETFQGHPYSAEFDSGDDAIRARTRSGTRLFARELVLELWQELRAHQLLTRKSAMPKERELSYLLPVLAALPYVEPVKVADTYDEFVFHNSSWGVQLLPPAEEPQRQRELSLSA